VILREPAKKVDAALFGQLVRRERERLGLTLQQLAVRAFDEEARVSTISELENNPRQRFLQASTVGKLRNALNLTDEQVDACRVASNQPVNTELERIANSGSMDEQSREAIDDALTEIKAKLAEAEFSEAILKGVVEQFLVSVGKSNLPALLWPATLREHASEFIALQEQLVKKQNLPEHIAMLNRQVGEEIAAGRFDKARQKAETINSWAESEYAIQQKSLEQSAEVFANSLLALAYVLMLSQNFETAKNVYLRILKISGISDAVRARASRSAAVTFNALIARAPNGIAARAVFDEMKQAGIEPDVFTFTTLISLAKDYAAGRAVFDEMKQAGIEPDVVTFNTLISLAKDYAAGRAVFDEMLAVGVMPNLVTSTTLIKFSPDFETALTFVSGLDQSWLVFSSGLYSALFAKPVDHLEAHNLIEIFFAGFRQFGDALQSPINQYRRAHKHKDAFLISLIAPQTGAAQKLYRERYGDCQPWFRAAIDGEDDNDNLHYGFGIAAALNQDWENAFKHLEVARQRATHEKRIAHIDQLLSLAPKTAAEMYRTRAEADATKSIFGSMKGTVLRYDDPFGPAIDPEEWNALK
jgi:pentatricopeptide repeat protein